MRSNLNFRQFGRGSLIFLALFVGCGKSSTPVADQSDADAVVADNSDQSGALPILAVPKPDDSKSTGNKAKNAKSTASGKAGPTLLPKGLFSKKNTQQEEDAPPAIDANTAQKPPEKGSPEWLLTEIQRVRILPLPHEEEEEDDSDDDDEDDKPLTAEQEKKLADEIERNRGIRRERNLQIVKLAEECLQKTGKNPEQELLFNAAVHHLLDARLQLALQGDKASVDSLYEADKVFFERDPKSDTASEAALTLVNFAHANALKYGQKDPRWLEEFSKQTRSYAKRFPDETPRSVPLLMAAARSCEMNGQIDAARECYEYLSEKHPDTPYGIQATNVMRRFQLKGQELEMSGPGLEGDVIDVKTSKGKMVLVIFWASNAQPFLFQLPKLTEVTTKYKKYLDVVSVNLDVDERAVEAFREANKLEWRHIFPENRDDRGWNAPLAVHYGVNSLPTMFLLDPNGIVAETNLDASNLEAKIREVYEPFRKQNAAQKKPATSVK